MQHVLIIPFEKKNDFKGVKYNIQEKVYTYECQDNETLPEILIPYKCKLFSLEWHIENKINKIKPKFNYPVIWKPKEHQSYASNLMKIAYEKKYPGFLLADDTGLGKTISTLDFVLNERSFKKILIVFPISVFAHWSLTLLNLGVSHNKNITLINYDKLPKLFQSEAPKKKLSSTRAKGKQKRIAREIPAPEFDVIIWDESHKCKNEKSAKSMLAEKLNAKANFLIWLSATAGQNPLELNYLRKLIAQQLKLKFNTPDLYIKWCKSFEETVLIEKIKKVLFESKDICGLRRRPQEISGWKELERNLYPMYLDEEALEDYKKSWEEFKSELINERKYTGKTKNKKENILVKSIRFRQKSSWLRIDSTVNLIMDYLESNKQVAISVAFKETQYKIAEILKNKKINSSIINGDMSIDEKEKERLKFQKGENKVVIFTVEEGISLHQGEYNDVERILLIHDIRWSAIQMAQIEGRCHRDGKFSPCYWLYADGTKDLDIGNALVKRVKNMKNLMGDDVKLLEEIEDIFIK